MELASFWVAGLKEFLVAQEALPSLEEEAVGEAFLLVQAVAAVAVAVAGHLISITQKNKCLKSSSLACSKYHVPA